MFLQRIYRSWRRPSPAAGQATVAEVLRRMLGLPFADLDAVTGGGTALVVAPHPDDESLGCGGLIAEACARGRPPVLVVLTDGSGSHPRSPSHPPGRLRARREAETRDAAAALGLPADRIHFMHLPDGAAPSEGAALEAAATRLAEIARRYDAGCVLATWEHDPHPDHLAASRIAAAAARAMRLRLVSYPVWGWMLPEDRVLDVAELDGVRLDIAGHLPAKRRAIAAHASQHAGGIPDDPGGFVLPPEFLAVHDRGFEVFLLHDAPGPPS